jgi:hypothetical protein
MADEEDPWTDQDFEAAVRDTAYFFWENDGRPQGREKQYWFAALEKCLRQREADGMLTRGPTGTGRQAGDTTDDVGRPLDGPKAKPLEQPVAGNKRG